VLQVHGYDDPLLADPADVASEVWSWYKTRQREACELAVSQEVHLAFQEVFNNDGSKD